MGTLRLNLRWWSHPRGNPTNAGDSPGVTLCAGVCARTSRAGLGAQSIYLEHSLSLERRVQVETLPVNVPSSSSCDQTVH